TRSKRDWSSDVCSSDLDQAIINRMGFNNDGVDAAKLRLLKRDHQLIIGGNIGKNKVTPNEKAVNDYLTCFDTLFEVVDYFVVNRSEERRVGKECGYRWD